MWDFILKFLKDLFGDTQVMEKKVEESMVSSGEVYEESEPILTRNERLLMFASGEIGVKEVQGEGNNAQVKKYHAYARLDNDLSKALPDSVPWCASFICYCLEMVGMGSTNSMMAKSYLKWGVSTKMKPLPGDIVVYWRGSKTASTGHVGVFLGIKSGMVYTLGGNQSDMVNISRYGVDKVLDFRRSSKMGPIDEVLEDKLWDMSDRLLAGEKIYEPGSVV